MSNGGEVVNVWLVTKKAAKKVKTLLESTGKLNRDFRMTPCTSQTDWIAIPVLDIDGWETIEGVVGCSTQLCPFSTALLGNHQQRRPRKTTLDGTQLSLVQRALLAAALPYSCNEQLVTLLSIDVCPRSLEQLGDDHTLVVPRYALHPETKDFAALLAEIGVDDVKAFMASLYESLATLYKSPRVVRRDGIDKESKVRESRYRLLWPFDGIPDSTGPGSPAWITVTEQGIRQSFDLTRVMFSRGNITEKIRFGKLVQRGEIVLDLYAGIGYFTLPALVHGEAGHVFCCEWNERAVEALRYNLADNGVDGRATVFVGDCRVSAEKHQLVDMVDRVSLGLLPSSEGSWSTAVKALRRATGGWLHIHGNVPVKEAALWMEWVASCLGKLVREQGLACEWIVFAHHLEKVKSFAPTVNHYVLDVFLGPPNRYTATKIDCGKVGVIRDGQLVECIDNGPPSCALSTTGPLNQAWMK